MLHARAALATAVAAVFLATAIPTATDAFAGKSQSGVASYYGKRFHGRRTANGASRGRRTRKNEINKSYQ